ncbi:hypothetical protein FB563_2429 [Streptomyces puniciscabiei]|uniref:Uncharacterized protein n=1 Tax=Streptomyces puniciscabiei TaxID=164348 RepID=A0A542UEG3_9ACTN|nr:hypothetical protein [Streptomyces puniciscabiei]TQK97463.1 hypothetical protein FB563_2429 [Streptomyces puniciscabiei]
MAATPFEELPRLPGGLGGRVPLVPLVAGAEVTPQRASPASSGHVRVQGGDVAETISRMQAVLDHFRAEALDQAA